MDTIIAILINIGCSIIAAIITVILLPILYSSNIKISPFIIKRKLASINEGVSYFFKIVNMSLYDVHNLTVELKLLRQTLPTSSALIFSQLIPIPLVAYHLALVKCYRPLWLRKEADNCIVFRTLENIEEILSDDNSSILITVTSQHSLTGFTKAHSLVYHSVNAIKEGGFMYGPKFGVLPLFVALQA
jgi:hypothetical protein